MCFAPQRRALFRHLSLQKVVQTPSVFNILTWKCASRHNGVHFCDISTSKSGPKLVCFVHFHFEMCFAPPTACTFATSQLPKVVRSWCVLCILTWKCASRHQRRALFRHLNCQKWSAALVFLTFWLGNVLRATTACTCSTSQLPKVVRSWCLLYILTWKCASRHNGMQFFISPLARCLRTRRFSEPTFRPSGATNHWKNTVNRASPSSFFLLFLFYSSLFWSFSSLCLCTALLFICPYCEKFDF